MVHLENQPINLLWLPSMAKIFQKEKKMRQYNVIKMLNTEHSWFGSDTVFLCTPLLRDHLSCKTTFLWQKGWSLMTGFTVHESITHTENAINFGTLHSNLFLTRKHNTTNLHYPSVVACSYPGHSLVLYL